MKISGLTKKIFPYLGKVLGILAGLLSGLGLAGIIIGGLLGHLADVIAAEKRTLKALKRLFLKPFDSGLPKDTQIIGATIALTAGLYSRNSAPSGLEQKRLIKEAAALLALSGREEQIAAALFAYFLSLEEPDLEGITRLFRFLVNKEQCTDMLSFLFRLAGKDMTRPQREFLKETARLLEAEERFSLLSAQYSGIKPEDYRILGVEETANPEEIKRVYRKLAGQFHPDSLSLLSDFQKEQSNTAFLKIKAAYERIIKERELNSPPPS